MGRGGGCDRGGGVAIGGAGVAIGGAVAIGGGAVVGEATSPSLTRLDERNKRKLEKKL